jgi:predicted phosphodiesterase
VYRRFFDLISDVHLDFWVKMDSNPNKMSQNIDAFVDSMQSFPTCRVLVIAGDLGHYNEQNMMFLKSLMRYYEHIILTRGNHDLYLVSNKQSAKYNHSSDNRWSEMKTLARKLGVFVLEGDTIYLDGTCFGGTGMWYDFSYGIKEFGKTDEEMKMLWYEVMSDPKLIKGLPDFNKEIQNLKSILDESDVIVTHVGGDWSRLHTIPENLRYTPGLTPSFYFFDGSEWINHLNGKVWCFGHTHDHYDYIRNGCRFVNNAIGYPSRGKRSPKIKMIGL